MITATGLKFFAAQQGLIGVPASPEVWELGGQTYDVVEPTERYAGTILSVHGMTPKGPRDPRLVQFHAALASVGFRVVAPVLRSVAELRIHAGQIDQIERAIGQISSHRGLTPSGRLSVFAPSFSGGLALIAASRSTVADRVRALLLLGPYGNIRTTMDALLTQPGFHPYAWKIVLSNFLEVVHRGSGGAAEALRVAALDDWSLAGPAQLPAFLDGLDDAQRRLARALLLDGAERRALWEAILDREPGFMTYGSVVDQIGGLRGRPVLLHGQDDPTIPARQSREIHRALQEVDHSSRLLITPALGHGGVGDPLTLLRDVPRLMEAFEDFFEHARTEPAVRRSWSPRALVSRTYRSVMSVR